MAAQVINKHLQQHIGKTCPPPLRYNFEREQTTPIAKQRSSSSRKSPVYVHQFNKINSQISDFSTETSYSSQNELHQTLYNHEMSSFGVRSSKLKSKPGRPSTKMRSGDQLHPKEISQKNKLENPTHAKSDPVHVHKPVVVKSTIKNKKLKQTVLSNKAEIHKLEESYWAKWKPNKSKNDKQTKPVPTPPVKHNRVENDSFEKTKQHIRVIPKNKQKERGDSNEAECDTVKHDVVTKQEKTEKPSNEDVRQPEIQNEQKPVPLILPQENIENEEVPARKSESKHSTHSVECDGVKVLKHTDSFILTSKKQNQEKTHYQQPKCIKLYKNSSTLSAPKSYIKGGTYPLKSCLKKEKPLGNIRLGRPGSPLIVQSCSSSKANRKKK